MMTNLIIATSESEGPLSQGRIDEILGVAPGRSARAPRLTRGAHRHLHYADRPLTPSISLDLFPFTGSCRALQSQAD